jgi:flagellar basal-body rod protein FlgF
LKTLDIAAAALQGDLQRLAHISQNLANVQTPGYKRLVTVQRPFAAQWDAAAMHGGPSALDTSAGALRATGNERDVAIDGDGYFAVHAPGGRAFTRRLSLRLDDNGVVVHESGQPVLGERGEMRAPPGAAGLQVDAQGEVFAAGRSVGRLQLWRVPAQSIRAAGNGLYEASAAEVQPLDNAKVAVGFQEASNVNSSAEMVRLMETTRHFEAVARAAQGIDEAMEKAIRKLGDL